MGSDTKGLGFLCCAALGIIGVITVGKVGVIAAAVAMACIAFAPHESEG